MWANGISNFLASVSSAFPVCGSFSRSSLNFISGARTPLSKITTMIVVIVALNSLTGTFQYIPNAALSAVIWAAIWSLISWSDAWECWKHDKRDFFVLMLTWTISLGLDTATGLAAGLSAAAGFLIVDMAFGKPNDLQHLKKAKDNNGVDVVRIHQEINFIAIGRIKDFIISLTFVNNAEIAANVKDAYLGDQIFHKVTATLDNILTVNKTVYYSEAPRAIVVDFSFVHLIDLTGLQGIDEIQREVRRQGVAVVFINVLPQLQRELSKFGIINNDSTSDNNLDEYLVDSGDVIPRKSFSGTVSAPVVGYSIIDENSIKRDNTSSEIELINVDNKNESQV